MAFVERGLVVGRNARQIAANQRNVVLIDDVRKERPKQSGHVDDTAELLRRKGPCSVQGAVMRGVCVRDCAWCAGELQAVDPL
jgi:hypothetical protein